MENIVISLQNIVVSIQHNWLLVLSAIGCLWLFNFINMLLGYRLNILGIYPRSWHGIIGIPLCPLLHKDFNHLFFNSIPLFMLINLLLLEGKVVFWWVTILIVILGGSAIWLFGRRALHIGASSLIMGYIGYLLANAYHQVSATTIILALICLYYFGGLLLSLVPGEKGVSWEGHIFGFLSGILVGFLL